MLRVAMLVSASLPTPQPHQLEAGGAGGACANAAAQQLDQGLGLEALGQGGACRGRGLWGRH